MTGVESLDREAENSPVRSSETSLQEKIAGHPYSSWRPRFLPVPHLYRLHFHHIALSASRWERQVVVVRSSQINCFTSEV